MAKFFVMLFHLVCLGRLKILFWKTLLSMNLDDSYRSESEFYYPDKLENHIENQVGNVNVDNQPETTTDEQLNFSSLNLTKK